jgi:hypothetical protein
VTEHDEVAVATDEGEGEGRYAVGIDASGSDQVHGAGEDGVAPHALSVDRDVEAVESIAGTSDVLRTGEAI